MTIYIVLYIILLLSSFSSKKNTLLLWFNILLLSFIAGIRDVSIGPDTITYNEIFEHISTYGDSYIDIGWMFMNLLISYIGGFNSLLFIVSLVTLIPIGLISRRYSPNPCLSLFIYYCIYAYLNSFNIMRQVMAISIVFCAYSLYERNKKGSCAVVMFTAMTIHASSALGFVVYLVKYVKLNSFKVLCFSLLSLFGGLMINNNLLTLLLGPYAFYLDSASNGYREDILSSFIMSLMVNIIFYVIYITSKSELKDSFWYKLYYIGILIMNLTFQLVLGTRIIMFFTLLQFLVYPIYFRNNIIKNKMFVFWIIILYLTLIFLKILILGNPVGAEGSIIPYKTFLY